MSQQDDESQDWSDVVSAASKHLEERGVAAADAAARAKPRSNTAVVAIAAVFLAIVAVWDVRVLTRVPDVLLESEAAADVRWWVADAVEVVEDFRLTEGRLPTPTEVEGLLGDDMAYEVRDGGYVVGTETGGVRVEFDGSTPLEEWVTLGPSQPTAEGSR